MDIKAGKIYHWVTCSIICMALLHDMTKGEQCQRFSNPVFSSIINNNVIYSVRLGNLTNKSYDNVVVQYQGNALSNGNCTYKYCVIWTIDDADDALVYLNLNISNSEKSESVQLDINVHLNCSAGNNTIYVCIEMIDDVNARFVENPLRRIHMGTSLVCLFISTLTIVVISFHIYNNTANVRRNREDELYSQLELFNGTDDNLISLNKSCRGSLTDEERNQYIIIEESGLTVDVHIPDHGGEMLSTNSTYEPLDS